MVASGKWLAKGGEAIQKIWRYSRIDLFPIRKQLAGYRGDKFQGDLKAGFNVALLAFPQGMAYALLAGLPIQYGIFGSVIAAMVAPFFAGTRHIVLGPTNATAVAVGTLALPAAAAGDKLAVLPGFLLLVGLFLAIGAFLRVATLIQYVSRTVVTGYITAAAFYIIVNQVHNVLGFDLPDDPKGVIQVLVSTVTHIPMLDWPSFILSALTFLLWWGIEKRFSFLPSVAITLVVMSFVGVGIRYGVGELGIPDRIDLLTSVSATDWPWVIPVIKYEWLDQMVFSALAVALLCVLEGTSIGKSLAAKSGEKLDANQEMLSIGVTNMVCGCGGGMAASGSLTRSALNATSGARTTLSSLINGTICLIGVFTLGSYIQYIPKAALAVVVITVGVSLINRHNIRVSMKSTTSDMVVFLVTVLTGLLVNLSVAIYVGVMLSIILFLRKASAPELVEYSFNDEGQLKQIEDKEERPGQNISIVHVEGNLFFGAAELFRDQIRSVCEDPSLKVIILRLKNARHLDATSVLALEELVRFLRANGRDLLVSGAMKDVIRVLRDSGLIDIINEDGRKNIFPGSMENPNIATRNALKRAQEILGQAPDDIKIFYDPNKK